MKNRFYGNFVILQTTYELKLLADLLIYRVIFDYRYYFLKVAESGGGTFSSIVPAANLCNCKPAFRKCFKNNVYTLIKLSCQVSKSEQQAQQ